MKRCGIILICALVSVSAYANETGSIWRIGNINRDFSEFALAGAPERQYNILFPGEVEFIVGESRESEAWPAVHPGQDDGWAGRRHHTYVIRFDLSEKVCDFYAFNIHLTSSHHRSPALVDVQVNNTEWHVQTSHGPGDNALRDPKAGGHQSHAITFKKDVLRIGENVIRITTQGSWMIYDALELVGYLSLAPVEVIEASSQNVCYRRDDGNSRRIDLKFKGGLIAGPTELTFDYDGKQYTRLVDPGLGALRTAEAYLPIGCESTGDLKISMHNGIRTVRTTLRISPVRKWEIHLVHQTHLDIGYTHKQEDVLRYQVEHLHNALKYIDASKDYPEEARFSWHPEGMWAVEEFLRTESEESRRRFIEATQTGDIQIDALYAQAMTGAYSEEELFELITAAARYGKEHGITVDSAMQTDVPGYTWGLVNALAHHGVKYMNVSPNHAHRIGHTFQWGDKPFYWVSPCGKNKILFWMSGKAYSWFHGRPVGHSVLSEQDRVLAYLDDLDKKGYPYDMVNVRYNIGADNGPPNPALPASVKAWNERYVWPKLIISRNSDMMRELERRYQNVIPVVKGDFTPYWEDGMASTSADTGISRRAKERLIQAQTLWTLYGSETYPHEEFERAWTNLIMYDEHTWGAHNSISNPDHEFAVQQALYKQQYALEGAALTDGLLERSLKNVTKADSEAINVYNTLNWNRSEVVYLTPGQSKAGDRVEDANGKAVPSQRLASGQLAFRAENVPALGAKRYLVRSGKANAGDTVVKVTDNRMANDSVRVEIDPVTGTIKQLRINGGNTELVDSSKGTGLNDYLYILGREAAENNMRAASPVKISVIDPGPVVGTLKVECEAPGARRLVRTIRIVQGSSMVEMDNVVDKLKERRPEGVYFSFPFNVPDGIMKIDTSWSVFQPEKDQIAAANKNFFCVQRFVDISNEKYGVTWMSVDAPIVQWDPIRIAHATGTQYFRTEINPNQTLHSWVMNNHWETNYKADQEGRIPFRYVIWPHPHGYDPVAVQQKSRSVTQPLLAVTVRQDAPVLEPMFQIDGAGIVVTSLKPCLDGDGYMVRLFNTADVELTAVLKRTKGDCTIWESNPLEEKNRKTDGRIKMVPQEIVTLRVSRQGDI
jgi:hypothetical protein